MRIRSLRIANAMQSVWSAASPRAMKKAPYLTVSGSMSSVASPKTTGERTRAQISLQRFQVPRLVPRKATPKSGPRPSRDTTARNLRTKRHRAKPCSAAIPRLPTRKQCTSRCWRCAPPSVNSDVPQYTPRHHVHKTGHSPLLFGGTSVYDATLAQWWSRSIDPMTPDEVRAGRKARPPNSLARHCGSPLAPPGARGVGARQRQHRPAWLANRSAEVVLRWPPWNASRAEFLAQP